MTKKLANLFNVEDETTTETPEIDIVSTKQELAKIDSDIDKIDAALPMVRDLDSSDTELDDLAELAKSRFNDLMDLGMNVESRFSGPIFQTAGVLLGHALEAKKAKLDKKIKMVDLQIKKLKLDKQESGKKDDEKPIDGEGFVLDRNSILAQIVKTTPKH